MDRNGIIIILLPVQGTRLYIVSNSSSPISTTSLAIEKWAVYEDDDPLRSWGPAASRLALGAFQAYRLIFCLEVDPYKACTSDVKVLLSMHHARRYQQSTQKAVNQAKLCMDSPLSEPRRCIEAMCLGPPYLAAMPAGIWGKRSSGHSLAPATQTQPSLFVLLRMLSRGWMLTCPTS